MEFQEWFEAAKESAQNDFGFSERETENFNEKNWRHLHEKEMSPFEGVSAYLKNLFKKHVK